MLEQKVLNAEEADGTVTVLWKLEENGAPVLTVLESMRDGMTVLRPSGSLRGDTDLFFRDELMLLAVTGGNITVECAKLSYVANVCKKSLIEVQRLMDKIGQGQLFLVNMPSALYQEFRNMGLTGALNIVEG